MREEIAKLSNAGAAPPFSISPIFRSRGCNTASSRLHRKANRGAGDVSPRRCPKLKRLARAQRSARRSSASCHGPFQVGTALDGYKVTGFDIDRPHKTLRGVGLGHFAQRTSSRAWESADFTETDFALFWNSARPFLVNQSELAVGLEPRGLDLTRSLRFHPPVSDQAFELTLKRRNVAAPDRLAAVASRASGVVPRPPRVRRQPDDDGTPFRHPASPKPPG